MDLIDAYHQGKLVAESRQLFGHEVELTQVQIKELDAIDLLPEGFIWDTTADLVRLWMRPVGLSMGFKNACAVWTKISRVLVAKWRREGKRLVHLLDDMMFAVSGELSLEEVCAVRDGVLNDMLAARMHVNWGKSILTPCKCIKFLRMLEDSVAYRFFSPEKKVEDSKVLMSEMVGRRVQGLPTEATSRELVRVVGGIMSMQIACPTVRMMTHECYQLIRPEGEWNNSTELTEAMLGELAGVVDWIVLSNRGGNPIRRFTWMQELVLTMNASSGYG